MYDAYDQPGPRVGPLGDRRPADRRGDHEDGRVDLPLVDHRHPLVHPLRRPPRRRVRLPAADDCRRSTTSSAEFARPRRSTNRSGSVRAPVIDVRLLRTDLEAVRAATARRGDPALLDQLDEAVDPRRTRARARPGARRDPRQGQRAVQGGRPAAPGRRRRCCRGAAGGEPLRSARPSASSPTSTTPPPPPCATSSSALPNLVHPDAPDGTSDADNPVVRGPINLPERVRRAPARPALGGGDRARHPRQRAGDQDQRVDVRHDARPRRHARSGAVPARPRPQRRCLRGDPPAVARHHGDADGERAAAEVRRRRLRRRARRPVVHPHRGGAAHVAVRRRDPRRGRPAGAHDGGHAVLPPRGGLGRSGHAWPAALARVRQGRDPRRRHAGAGAGAARRDGRPCRGHDRRPRAAVADDRDLRRRPRPEPPPQLRHRGLRPRRRHSGWRSRR